MKMRRTNREIRDTYILVHGRAVQTCSSHIYIYIKWTFQSLAPLVSSIYIYIYIYIDIYRYIYIDIFIYITVFRHKPCTVSIYINREREVKEGYTKEKSGGERRKRMALKNWKSKHDLVGGGIELSCTALGSTTAKHTETDITNQQKGKANKWKIFSCGFRYFHYSKHRKKQ